MASIKDKIAYTQNAVNDIYRAMGEKGVPSITPLHLLSGYISQLGQRNMLNIIYPADSITFSESVVFLTKATIDISDYIIFESEASVISMKKRPIEVIGESFSMTDSVEITTSSNNEMEG